ncbi:restriction endonuclease subunit S [Lutimaribacter sp. EGI FJ00015]|uniref:Restriction endonuclease subunit S n=1 Tax=Lutimaribacter degradans TaxID=2945989 RepID=A0ACC5ZVY8_9RHOB|nr:restriction endonuclease subunit S [Lutimaribacter sp. EGI FJ00013]MCM2562507.1 restriction endonuclease subunit S [Lutimaribacter sp. EGI FJ00013]MCO0613664.1 restriction endonuclease subunit S [Lutimaribacter sp. EGI FJ00015]MCO0636636.1 restriction endonuclease subunit S [Lutimaribacter sp. EGI FJ00014]
MSDTHLHNWPTEKLADLCEINIGGTPSRSVPAFWAEPPDGHAWLSIADMKQKYLFETKEHITDLGARSSNVKAIAPDTLVMSFKLSVGKAGIVKRLMYCNEAIAIFQPLHGRVDHRWLYFSLPRAAATAVTDTAVKGATFNKASLAKLALAVPAVPLQSKIAEVLDTLDTAIRGTEAVVAKLKAMKQGLLHDLLTRGIDANGDLRPPQPEAPHLYKQTPLGWMPKEWEDRLLDDVAQRGSGHTPSKSIASYWNGGIKWVSLADSHRLDQVYISETDKEISEAGLANSSAVRHPENTVILSRDAGIGKSAILASEMAVSQHFMAWRCSPRLNHVFLYYLLQREKPKFEAIAMGSTIKTIGLSFFKKYVISLPPKGEQDRSAEILLEMEGNIGRNEQELRKLRAAKSGLMDDLLTGRVPVTPLL